MPGCPAAAALLRADSPGRWRTAFRLETGRAEVDQEADFDAGGLQVADDLGDVLVGDSATRLQLHDQAILYEQVYEVFSQHGAVLVVDGQGVLLERLQPLFPQPVPQRILVDLLQVPAPVVAVNCKTRLAHHVAESIHVFPVHLCSSFSWLFVFFAAIPLNVPAAARAHGSPRRRSGTPPGPP